MSVSGGAGNRTPVPECFHKMIYMPIKPLRNQGFTPDGSMSLFDAMACDRFEQPVSCAFNSRLQKHTPVRKFWQKLAQVSPLQQTLGESTEAGRPY